MVATIEQLTQFLAELEIQVRRLGRNFEQPQLIEVNGAPEFRHQKLDDLLLSYLKCVRSVSSLNASVLLLRSGFVQEVGAICRCVDEFCEDVMFLATPLGEQEEHSKDQRRLMEEFFQEEFPEDVGSLMKTAPRNRVPRDKVRAGIARIHSMPINPHDANQLQRALGRAFSGYIHGAYVHIMEMYGGPTLDQCRFYMNGMLGTSRIPQWVEALSNYVFKFAIATEIVARRCNDEEVKRRLEVARLKFEDATGVGTGDPNGLLKTSMQR